ncbi:hypothetical protein ACFY7H_22815 [Streptomyces sp. NPDC012794]|uniref:hypothetical protein n=1 Tax=Streptomyces sp. NPDC012794 TaxID=3364850 RepID=UPI00367DCF8D
MPAMVGTALRLARLADAPALRTVLGAELGLGIGQAAGLGAVNSVHGHLMAPGPTTARLTAAVPALVLVAVTGVLGALLRSASTAATGALEPKVHRPVTEQYLALGHRVELTAIEDDEFHRLMDAARYGADSARRMIRYCANVLNSAVSLIAAAGMLTVFHPLLLPLLVLMTFPSAWGPRHQPSALRLLPLLPAARPCRAPPRPAAHPAAGRRRGTGPLRGTVPAHSLPRHGRDQRTRADPAGRDVPSTAPARATGRRILLIASGGAADLRQVDPALLHPADRLVLNDVGPNALQYASRTCRPRPRPDRRAEASSTTSKNASPEP